MPYGNTTVNPLVFFIVNLIIDKLKKKKKYTMRNLFYISVNLII